MCKYSNNVINANGNIVTAVIGNNNSICLSNKLFRMTLETRHSRKNFAEKRFSPDFLPILAPDATLTEFVGRDKLLEDFVTWAKDKAKGSLSLRIVCGPGGAGKTRFALELIKKLEEASSDFDYAAAGSVPPTVWVAGFLRGEQLDELGGFGVYENLAWPNPTLLVVDYAAVHLTGICKFLKALQEFLPEKALLRVLLLERSASDEYGWAADLRGRIPNQWDGIIELPFLPEEFRLAILRSAIKKLSPKDVEPILDDQRLLPLLREPRWTPLLLMMAASEAVISGKKVMDILLLPRNKLIELLATRELKRLVGEEDETKWDSEKQAKLSVVLCSTLIHGLTELQVEQLLSQLKLPEKVSPHQCFRSLQDQFGLIENKDNPKIGWVQPDLIGEMFIYQANRALYGNTRNESLLVRLSSAFAVGTVAETLIRIVHDFLPWKEDGKKNAGDAALVWLDAILPEFKEENLPQLKAIAYVIPKRSTALLNWSCNLFHGIMSLLESNNHSAESLSDLAISYNILANLLSDRGEKKEAKEYALKAVKIWEKLAAESPLAYEPDLAGNYNNLANRLSDLGEKKEAKEYALKAVEIWEKLLAKNPLVYDSELARSYNNLSVFLRSLGENEEAKRYSLKAVRKYEKLAAESSSAYEPDLAMSYNSLSMILSALGEKEEAKGYSLKAVGEYEKLAVESLFAYEPDLAMSYNNLASQLSDLGEREKAKKYALKAIGKYEKLVVENSCFYEPGLGIGYNSLAVILNGLGEKKEAKEYALKAVKIREKLAAESSSAYEPDLAMSYNSLAVILSDLGEKKEAKEYIRSAVDIFEKLAAETPPMYAPGLGGIYNNLAIQLSDLGENEGAKKCLLKAVKIYERLAAENPLAYNPDLAMSYNNLANRLSDLGEKKEAKEYAFKAVNIYEKLVVKNPLLYEPILGIIYNSVVRSLSDLGENEEAKDYAFKAVGIFEKLEARDPSVYEPNLAMSYNSLANTLHDLGKTEEAKRYSLKAVEKYEKLAHGYLFLNPGLGISYHTFSLILSDLGEKKEAKEYAFKAAEVFEHLTLENPLAYNLYLATIYINLSNRLSDLGEKEAALNYALKAKGVRKMTFDK